MRQAGIYLSLQWGLIMIRFQVQRTVSLRLSPTFHEQARQMARREGISLSHFTDMALAEKISQIEQAALLAANTGNMNTAIPAMRKRTPMVA